MHYSIEDHVAHKLHTRNGSHFGCIELAERFLFANSFAVELAERFSLLKAKRITALMQEVFVSVLC